MHHLLSLAACLLSLAVAAPEKRQSGPVVQLDYATIIGSSALGIDSFKGIPYAQPPIGPLRLKPPQSITKNLGVITAVGVPKACPQFLTSTNSSNLPVDVITTLTNTGVFQAATNAGEDCLTINVQRPSTATATFNLPVLFWIFSGGFEFGSTQSYEASEFLASSSAQSKDIIYVAVNYRVGAFGWLAGKEILKDGSSNLGLLDQRLGLQWVADNIARFGGDPAKVTIWGESAGAISVFNQMALYDRKHLYKSRPLFRAAIMDSGSVVPADPVDCPKAQDIYNFVVARSGCANVPDTLSCLRTVPYETFFAAANSVPGIFDYQSVALSYLPRPDGVVLTRSPDLLAISGSFAPVPFIIGDQEDEGTLFSLSQNNISTTKDIVDYLQTYYFLSASRSQIQSLVDLYPDDPALGSPFRTGRANNIYPQFKRLAAMLGDLAFTLTRRVFLHFAALSRPGVPSWSYLATYNYGTAVLGTFHASDVLVAYGYQPSFASRSVQKYYSNFVVNLDPNVGTGGLTPWPRWSEEGRALLGFEAAANQVLRDEFREGQYRFLLVNASSFYI